MPYVKAGFEIGIFQADFQGGFSRLIFRTSKKAAFQGAKNQGRLYRREIQAGILSQKNKVGI